MTTEELIEAVEDEIEQLEADASRYVDELRALRQQLAAAEARERALATKARKLAELVLKDYDADDNFDWMSPLVRAIMQAALDLRDYMQTTPAPAGPDVAALAAGAAAGDCEG